MKCRAVEYSGAEATAARYRRSRREQKQREQKRKGWREGLPEREKWDSRGGGDKYKRVEGGRRQGWSVWQGKWERQRVHHGKGTELGEGASNSFTTGTIQLLLRAHVERNPCQTACLTNVISSIDDIRCRVPTLNHWQMKRNDASFCGNSSRKLLPFSTETKPNQSWSHYLSHPNHLPQEELIPYAANCWLLPLNSQKRLFYLRQPCWSLFFVFYSTYCIFLPFNLPEKTSYNCPGACTDRPVIIINPSDNNHEYYILHYHLTRV